MLKPLGHSDKLSVQAWGLVHLQASCQGTKHPAELNTSEIRISTLGEEEQNDFTADSAGLQKCLEAPEQACWVEMGELQRAALPQGVPLGTRPRPAWRKHPVTRAIPLTCDGLCAGTALLGIEVSKALDAVGVVILGGELLASQGGLAARADKALLVPRLVPVGHPSLGQGLQEERAHG